MLGYDSPSQHLIYKASAPAILLTLSQYSVHDAPTKDLAVESLLPSPGTFNSVRLNKLDFTSTREPKTDHNAISIPPWVPLPLHSIHLPCLYLCLCPRIT